MSKSPKITISSDALREIVENKLNEWITDEEWQSTERAAREKIERLRQMNPDAGYYDDRYLAILAAEIYTQSAQMRAINSDAHLKWRNNETRKAFCN